MKKLILVISILFFSVFFAYAENPIEDLLEKNWLVDAQSPDKSISTFYFTFYPDRGIAIVRGVVKEVEYNYDYTLEIREVEKYVLLFEDNPNVPYFVFHYEDDKWSLMSPAAGMLRFNDLELVNHTEK